MTSKTLPTNNELEYLSTADLLLIHTAVIDETGGSHGVRDNGRIEAIIGRPKQTVFGKTLFPTLFEKAGSYGFDIIHYHPFVDGNKRTGMTAMAVFLECNGFLLKVEKGLIEEMALKIIEEKLEVRDIALWLKKHSKRIK